MRPLSARNPRISSLAKLARKRGERTEQRAFVVEGPTLLGVALDHGAALRDVYVDEATRGRPAVAAVLARVPAEVTTWRVPEGTLDRVGDAVTSQGVLAVVEFDDTPWPSTDRASFVLVLVDVADPGNAGTLIRAAAASGADAVVVVGGADPWSPKVVRSSAGSVLATDVVAAADAVDAIERLRAGGYRVLASTVSGGEAFTAAVLDLPLAVILGNEAAGVAPDVLAACDGALTIDMAGPVDSLNVAMAGTLLCFEVLRRAR
jgi:TrmH family RNA methyltransferase